MIKENKKTKRNVAIIIIGLILVVAIATLSYALWTRNFTETGVNKNIYDCFQISYQETKGNGVTLEHGYPQTDEQGMQNNPYEITVKNTCKTIATYNVILNKENSSTLNEQYLKVAVGDNFKKLNEYDETTTQSISGFSNAKAYIIGTGVLTPDTTKIIDVRSWMDENTSVANGSNKEFTFKITIEATSGLTNDKLLAANILKSYPITPEEKMENGYGFYRIKESNQTVNIDVSRGMCVTSNLSNINYALTEMYEYKCGITTPEDYRGYYTFGDNDDYLGNGRSEVYEILETQGSIITKANVYKISDKYDLEEGIVATPDDDGTSYVLRGKINDNYVKFADKDWRVVRINGDGTIRLILKDRISPTGQKFNPTYNGLQYVGYTYGNTTKCTKASPCKSTYVGTKDFTNSNGGTNSDIKTYLEEWYHTNLEDKDNQIAYGTYCNDTTISRKYDSYTCYGSYGRIVDNNEASLKCPDTNETYGGLYKLKIGLLTADEMNIAGLSWTGGGISSDYYMYYGYDWWSMSPYYAYSTYANEFQGDRGYINYFTTDSTYAVLPVINLNSDIQITGGDGTENNPYVVK